MILFISRTGNVRWIAEKVSATSGITCVEVKNYQGQLTQPFLLMTYTDALGETPKETWDFLKEHHALCKGVIGSGNRNFGSLFCKAIDNIEQRYGIPALHKIDLRGSEFDVERIVQLYGERF